MHAMYVCMCMCKDISICRGMCVRVSTGLASPNVRWRLSRPITSENGLLGQAEDFNLLGHPAEQRGEFYKLKCVGWCVGWLRRVRRVTLLALHQLTCRRLDNEHSLTMAWFLWPGSFGLAPLAWLRWHGSCGLAPLARILPLGSAPLLGLLLLGSFALASVSWLL